MATRNQYDATRQELGETWQPISGAFNFTYTSLAGFPRLLLHHDGSLYVLAAEGSIMWIRPEYQINNGVWTDSGWGVDGLKCTFPNGFDGAVPMQCNRPCFPGAYPAGTVIRTRMMAKCSGSVVLCDSNLVPQTEAVKTWTQSESHTWNDAEDDINPVVPGVIFKEIAAKGAPVTTGNIWGGNNTNTHFVPIEGNRYAWFGGRQDYAQVVIGSVDSNGVITQGTLNEHEFPGVHFGGASTGNLPVASIGNNKFATPYSSGYVIFDCGITGSTSAVFVTDETCMPKAIAGFTDGDIYSNGYLYRIGGHTDGYHLTLYRVPVNNTTGNFGLFSIIGSTFGTLRSVFQTEEIIEGQGCVCGSSINGGGVVFAARTADIDESSNPGLDLSICNGTSISIYRCPDNDGYPFSISVDENGVFAMIYRLMIPDGRKMRIRVGKITNFIPTFGGYIDLYAGAEFTNLVPASIRSGGNGEFAAVVQDWVNTSKQNYFILQTDGVSVSCDDTKGLFFNHQTNAPPQITAPVRIISGGHPGIYIVGNYGADTFDFGSRNSRFATALLRFDCELEKDIASGVSEQVSIGLDEWKYWRITSQAGDTSLVVNLTGIAPAVDLDLYVLNGAPPRFKNNDYSEGGAGLDEQVTVTNSGVTTWWIGVHGYTAGDATLTAILS